MVILVIMEQMLIQRVQKTKFLMIIMNQNQIKIRLIIMIMDLKNKIKNRIFIMLQINQ